MNFDEKTRKLTSGSGYIRSLDDSLYVDHSIYLGKYDDSSNYEEGDEEGFAKWSEERDKEARDAEEIDATEIDAPELK